MRRKRRAINNLSLCKNIIMHKAPRQSSIKHLCASRAQNDGLEATLSHSVQAQRSGVHIEVQSTKKRDITAKCIKSVPQFIEPFLLTVLNFSYCAHDFTRAMTPSNTLKYHFYLPSHTLLCYPLSFHIYHVFQNHSGCLSNTL